MLGWPKRCKLAHAFMWAYIYKRLKLAQLLGHFCIFHAYGERLGGVNGRGWGPDGERVALAVALAVDEGPRPPRAADLGVRLHRRVRHSAAEVVCAFGAVWLKGDSNFAIMRPSPTLTAPLSLWLWV